MVVLIYRPPKSTKEFIDEFAELLNGLKQIIFKLLIIGDFNIHVCCGIDL